MNIDSGDMLAENDFLAFIAELAAYLRLLKQDPENGAEVVSTQQRLRASYFRIVDEVIVRTGWSNPLGIWPEDETDDDADTESGTPTASEPFNVGVGVTVVDGDLFRRRASLVLGPDCLGDPSTMSDRSVFALLFARAMHDILDDFSDSVRIAELDLN